MSGVVDVVALSPAQRGLVLSSSATRDYDPYLVTVTMRIRGLGDTARLRTSFDRLCTRHPQLTALVRSRGLPHPVFILREGVGPIWAVHDFRERPDPAEAARAYAASEGHRPLDPGAGPLIRVTMLRLAEDMWDLVLTIHHAVIDGWCLPQLLHELAAIDRGEEALLPPPVPLRRYASWIAQQDPDRAEAAWAKAFAGALPVPRIGDGTIPEGIPEVGEFELGEADRAKVHAFGQGHGLTIATLLQLAWARILSGMQRRDDVVFGQTSSGRHPGIPGGARIIAGLVTTTPVRILVDDRHPAEIGDEVQRQGISLREHDWLGAAAVARAVGADDGEIFDTLLVVENTPTDGAEAGLALAGGARAEVAYIASPSHYPIAVVPVVHGERIIIRVECHRSAGLAAAPLAERMARVLVALTEAESLAAVEIALPGEQRLIGRGDIGWPPCTVEGIAGALAAAAAVDPEAPAIVDAEGTQSYAAMLVEIRELAGQLRAHGVEPGTPVAVALHRTRRVIQAPFAIAEAGGVTVHLDPEQPVDRIRGILEDAGCGLVLAHPDLAERLTADAAGALTLASPGEGGWEWSGPAVGHGRLPAPGGPRRPAYVVFTSGTTGRPKGVAVSHEALLSYHRHHEDNLLGPVERRLGRKLRVGHAWSTGFDAAWQPQIALFSGHCLILADEATRNDPELLVNLLRRARVDVFDTTPSMLNRLDEAGLLAGDGHGLSVLALGGEAIRLDLWRRLRGLSGVDVWNCYGPTETTVEALMAEVHDHARPCIGRPLDRMSAEVLDHRRRMVPRGVIGELALSGPQVAEGYVGLPRATAEVFEEVDDDAGARRRYLTGDLVRRLDDDVIAYVGRADAQLKINGYRVEPDEVAVALRGIQGVDDAMVVALPRDDGRMALGALVRTGSPIPEIRRRLARRVPFYMVPTRFAIVDRIPVNANGKADADAAAGILARAGSAAAPAPAAGGAALRVLTDAVAEVLGERPDPSLDLRGLGLDSLGVMDVCSRVRHHGWLLSVQDAVGAATLPELAETMTRPSGDHAGAPERTRVPLGALARIAVRLGGHRGTAHTRAIALPPGTGEDRVRDLLRRLIRAHPILGARLRDADGEPVLDWSEPNLEPSLRTLGDTPDIPAAVAESVAMLSPEDARMMVAAIAPGVLEGADALLLTINHLAVDMVSFGFLLEDLRDLAAGVEPPPEDPWPEEGEVRHRVPAGPPLGARHADPGSDSADLVRHRRIRIASAGTAAVLEAAAGADAAVLDVLSAATLLANRACVAQPGPVWLTRNTHGRGVAGLGRVVGWFTDEETLAADPADPTDPLAAALTARRIPDGLAAVRLNHLGRLPGPSAGVGRIAEWAPVPADHPGMGFPASVEETPQRFTMSVITAIADTGGRVLDVLFIANAAVLTERDADEYVAQWIRGLAAAAGADLAEHVEEYR